MNSATFRGIVNLLTVCRQICDEAALMLYELNTFLFERPEDLTEFKEAVTPAQYTTIRRIRFAFEGPGYLDAEDAADIAGLLGVRNLTLFASTEYLDIPPDDDEDLGMVEEQCGAFGYLRAFRSLILQAASVTIHPKGPVQKAPPFILSWSVGFSFNEMKERSILLEKQHLNSEVKEEDQGDEIGNNGERA